MNGLRIAYAENKVKCILRVYLVCLQSKMSAHCLNDEPKESLKRFVFSTNNEDYEDDDKLEIVIPEVSNIKTQTE